MGDDWDAYREAFAWLRDFADQKNTDIGRVMVRRALVHAANNRGSEGESAECSS